ncbi:MAG: LacI family DNA-binding transcriptional regulator [Phycisphaerales bacterium]
MGLSDAKSGSGGRGGKPRRAVSINDVASRASVSIATVSRVINRSSAVAPATAERVQRAINDLGYRPNLFAKGLVTSKSRVIGISMPDLHGDFFSTLMQSADDHAYNLGYHLLVMSNSHDGKANPAANEFARDLIDGLVTLVTESEQSPLESLRELNFPVIVLGADVRSGNVSSISFDQEVGARQATAHLLASTEPDRVMFVGGHKGNLDSDARLRAFAAEVRGQTGHDPDDRQIAHGEFSFDWGWSWAQEMLAGGGLEGAAVLAGNDEIAVGIVDAARDSGLSVPGDLRVVGFDDSRLCQLLRPTLSSVRVPIREAAQRAIEAIVDRIEDPSRSAESTTLVTSLVVRESSQFEGIAMNRKA